MIFKPYYDFKTRHERKPASSIGFETRWNPMLKLSREAFVDALLDVPPKPDEAELILRFNQGRAEDPES